MNKLTTFFKQNIVLITIIVLASLLRMWGLGQNPPSLNWDEAAFGYNAYSIATTLRDEHGRFLPFDYFASFGDYKPPVYVYLDVPFVKLLGPSAFSVRLPSALAGILTVYLTYVLVLTLFKDEKYKKRLALASSFVLAISPWHFMMSRAAFESNVATMLIVLGMVLFLNGIDKSKRLFTLSAIPFVLSLYTFNSPRVFVPLLLLFLFVLFFSQLRKKLLMAVIFVGLFSIILAPLIPHLLSKEGQLRFREVNIFTDESVVEQSNQRIGVDDYSLVGKALHNRRVGYALLFVRHYFDHFNPSYLFFHGDINSRFSTQLVGELYLIELPFLLLGIYFIVTKKGKTKFVVIGWLLLGLIPASTARETPHALRTLDVIPTYQIMVGCGLVYLLSLMGNIRVRKLVLICISLGYLASVTFFLYDYVRRYPSIYATDWQYGHAQLMDYVSTVKDKYDEVWFIKDYGRPYIFVAFYGKYPPSTYLTSKREFIDNAGFYHVTGFDTYYFNKQFVPSDKKILYISAENKVPDFVLLVKQIPNLNGGTAFTLSTNTNEKHH